MDIKNKTINTIRLLCAESVQKAKSGHPGLPLGIAPAAFTLWSEIMKHSPKNPKFINRDRFVLSAGHGSTLVYSLFHLFGYGLSIEDLKNFRQLDSLTPGHPEFGHTKGVEVTTGPLGQGVANAVGMAIAENHLSAVFNKPDCELIDHYTYALCGDGCMMEGISGEAASLAGTLGLGKLILLYDSNNITIEGSTDIAFRENVADRFKAYGWHVQLVTDGNDTSAIADALRKAKAEKGKPSLIEIKTMIGCGAPNKQGKASAHGEPLGADEISLMKEAFNFPAEDFYVPADVSQHMSDIINELNKNEDEWNKLVEKYKGLYPDNYKEFENWNNNVIGIDLFNDDDFWTYEGDLATRISSEQVLNKVCKYVPNLIGGSADLSPSTKTIMKGRGDYSGENPGGSNMHFGIREHAMTAIANGMAVHGGVRPYIAGFFVFSDYMKPAMRLSAMMKLPVINILTHDSIGVGEDGPTHQPIEQLASLRSIPNFTVFRPCDTNETAAAWYVALNSKDSPTAIVASRQNLKLLPETGKNAVKGGYILRDSENPDIILIASGSEVELIYAAYDELKQRGINARVVSMPSMEVFDSQPEEYRLSVLPKNIRARLAVEAASGFGWHKYIGLDGEMITMTGFGASAPYSDLLKKYGFTVDNIVTAALRIINKI